MKPTHPVTLAEIKDLDRLLINPHDANLKKSSVPPLLQRIGIALFVVLVFLSGFLSYTEHWRRATFALGAAMMWLSLLRLVCDSRVMGILSVRSRGKDAVFTGCLGFAMLFLSASVDALGS
ncbi:DUF3017 domain-containing protein [Corynebacterium sp. ES2794-CONJ1]|uniref:DUF3017 domain-containing protein n=1 Tax=unclassified Corynebacterium TaxID=2624378 RepID=UPI0021681621|nr:MULTISPECIES: DUF3017 domain-containing protein [unclassified Corynebacterium]MCS4489539.1 DUF3017 domain-containing protein [Corynebacterium sp. ES2775-CONJ]MCS4491450.1 DUF3017 domain-containing protein [Corynebacterium sp. ES2715-CONJ3]MCS4531449.1 DUF3017 domain-containing protein [Corynebacterium sp. ES2730-CONJ]MCU9518837.1 DUF3017 domain-containing protein [Corynebacterium sp. ES2794-CONJ1]